MDYPPEGIKSMNREHRDFIERNKLYTKHSFMKLKHVPNYGTFKEDKRICSYQVKPSES